MDTGTIVSLSISGAALAFSVYVFFVERYHKKKYDERLAQLEIDEKEKSLEEEKKAFIRCTPLKREAGKQPRFLIENVGKHPACNLVIENTLDIDVIRKNLFPFAKLDPMQGVEVYYIDYSVEPSVNLRFTYTDGRGEQEQEVVMQIH